MSFSRTKRLTLFVGLYRPARALHRVLFPKQRLQFLAQRSLYAEFVRPGDLVFDVGANIGNKSAVFLSLGASVVAFEPQPACAREVAARGTTRLAVVRKAVGEAIGSASLNLKRETALASLVLNWGGETTATLEVEVTTLDAAIAEFGIPSFCKIDVEGFEPQVLRGLTTPIKVISLEYHSDARGTDKIRTCLELLSRLGDYEINLTGHESSHLSLPTWQPMKEFMHSFPESAKPFAYGDLFARLR
jgi:FkbM family methyltransferase